MNTVILIPALLESFTARLRREEKSPFTVEKYVRDVRVFMTFAGERTLSKELVMEHKAKLLANGYAKGSVNSMLASVNSFLKFIERPDCRVANVRVQRRLYCPEEKNLDKAEYMRLRAAAKGKPRLYLILETLSSTGIRISELKYFTVEALQQKTVNVSCKNKTRTIVVPKELRKRLLEYAGKNGVSSGVIFRTRNNNPVNRSNVWAEMKKLCEKAKVCKSKVFPHNFRKLFARLMYELSKDIAQLADLLGHSSINTTRIYIMMTEDEVRCKVEKLSRMMFAEEKKKPHYLHNVVIQHM